MVMNSVVNTWHYYCEYNLLNFCLVFCCVPFLNRVAREGWVRGGGELNLLKFGDEVRSCTWRLCRTGVKMMAMTTCRCWKSTYHVTC